MLAALAPIGGFLLLWALFSWCTPHFDRSDVVGVYVAKYPSGTETLELKEDGTFVQEVVRKVPQDATPVTRTGTWTFSEDGQDVAIEDCALVDGDGGATFGPGSAVCVFILERTGVFFGPITLGGDTYPVTGVWSSGAGLRKK